MPQLFQFHSGSIQTGLTGAMAFFVSTMFQFHSGSIQTRGEGTAESRGACVSIPLWFDSNNERVQAVAEETASFNSTLVRFKPAKGIQATRELLRFNSTLVRFKQSEQVVETSSMSGFNSTLVRFKPGSGRYCDRDVSRVSIPLWFDSNFLEHLCKQYRNYSFNSTLVRFKPLGEVKALNEGSGFQFHSGSIQTIQGSGSLPDTILFQFHSGSIQTYCENFRTSC